MKHRRTTLILTALVAVALVAAGAVYLTGRRPQDTEQLLSASAAEILGGDRYYLKYIDRWLLSDASPVEMEEARDGETFFQRYEMYGEPLTTISRGCVSKVWSGGEFLGEIETDVAPSEMYTDLRFDGNTGKAMLGEKELYFEQYTYRYNNTTFQLRFLFSEGQLWGLEFGRDGRCLEDVVLSREIPEDVAALMAE